MALSGVAGVVDHGLYPSSMVTEVLIGSLYSKRQQGSAAPAAGTQSKPVAA